MRIVLVESTCSRTFNMGDEAILAANLALLKRHPEIRSIVLTPNPKATSLLHRTETFPSFYSLIKSRNRFLKIIQCVLIAGKLLFNAHRIAQGKDPIGLSQEERRFLELFAKADAFLIVGSGIIRSSALFFDGNASGLFPKCLEILLAKKLKKPIFLGAQTIGPFDRSIVGFLSSLFVCFSLKCADFVSVRDYISYSTLRKWGVYCVLLPDDSFQVSKISRKKAIQLLKNEGIDLEAIKREKKFLVGVSFRAWGNLQKRVKIRIFLERLLGSLATSGNFYFLFIPTMGSWKIPQRMTVAEKYFLKKLPRNCCGFVKGPYSWREIKAFWSLMDLALVVSFHSGVFAFSSGVPALGFYEKKYYQMKLGGLFSMMNQRKFLINVNREPLEHALYKVQRILEEKEQFKKKICQRAHYLRKRCCLATRKLLQSLL